MAADEDKKKINYEEKLEEKKYEESNSEADREAADENVEKMEG